MRWKETTMEIDLGYVVPCIVVLFAFIGFTAVLGFIYVRLTERKRNE